METPNPVRALRQSPHRWLSDFSCITPTPPLNTVPYIGGEDDSAWGPRPEVI